MGPLTIQFAVNKTSLDFICSPISASPNPPVNLRSLIEPRISSRSPLECLPRDNLALIAFHLSVDASGIGRHPAPLIPLFLTSRAIYNAISFDNNPQLYNSLFRATFDHTALSRRYNWLIEHVADVAGRGRNVFDLFSDPRSWAIEYKTRWELAWRMRQVSKHGRIDLPGICDKKQLSADLWNIWFLLTENGESSLSS